MFKTFTRLLILSCCVDLVTVTAGLDMIFAILVRSCLVED